MYHGTDVAIIGGLLGFDTFDERIKTAIQISEAKGIDIEFRVEDAVPVHPNTAKITISDEKGELELTGISIGGGKIEITELNGFELRLSGNHPTILVVHNDKFGTIAGVANVLAKFSINVGHMEVARKDIGQLALMTIEVDQNIDDHILDELSKLPNIIQVTKIAD